MIIGIHSPEFDFEKVHSNVEAAVKRDDVTWPVALDDDMTIWNAFNNQYWPADYIADRTGHIRYTHFGEGGYANTENVIRKLLGVAATSPRAQVTVREGRHRVAPEQQPGDLPRPAVPGPEQPLIEIQPGAHDYPVRRPGRSRRRARPGGELALGGQVEGALVGKWTADDRGGHVGRGRRHDPARRARQGSEPRDGDGDRQADRRGGRARRPAGAGGRPRLERARRRATAARS